MLSPSTYALADAQISARGAKSCALTDKAGKVTFYLGSSDAPVTSPFGATCYGDESGPRKTLELRLSPNQDEEFQKFDTWAREYIEEHSERIFKKKLNQSQIEEHYRSPVTRREGYQPMLRCKLNTEGRHAARIWDEDGQRTQLPEDLRDYEMIPKLQLSHLWILGKQFGFTLNCTDLMIMSGNSENVCPFTN